MRDCGVALFVYLHAMNIGSVDALLIKSAVASSSKFRGDSGMFGVGYVPNVPTKVAQNTASVPPPPTAVADKQLRQLAPTTAGAPAPIAAPEPQTPAVQSPPPASPKIDSMWAEAMRRIGPPKVGWSGRIKRSSQLTSLASSQPKQPQVSPKGPVETSTGLSSPAAPMRHFAATNPYAANHTNYSPSTSGGYEKAPIQGMPAANWDTSRLNPILKAVTDMGYSYAMPAYNPAQAGMSPFGTQVTSFADPIYSGMAQQANQSLNRYRPVFSGQQGGGGVTSSLFQLLQELAQGREQLQPAQ